MVKTIAVTEYADFIRYETLKDGEIFMMLIEVIVMNGKRQNLRLG